MKKMMVQTPLASWVAERWTDLALAIAWLIDHDIGTAEEQAAVLLRNCVKVEKVTDVLLPVQAILDRVGPERFARLCEDAEALDEAVREDDELIDLRR